MPKVVNTRKQRAAELLAMLERGPSLRISGFAPLTVKEIQEGYKLWVETWVIPELKALVPELKGK